MLKVGDVVQLRNAEFFQIEPGQRSPLAGRIGVVVECLGDGETGLYEVRLFDQPDETFPVFGDECQLCRR